MILYEETKCCFVKFQLQSPKFAAAMNHSQLPRNFPLGSAPCSLASQAPASSTFCFGTNQPSATSQQYFSLRTNQHQPRHQPNEHAAGGCFCGGKCESAK
jgi:hypothetical protein